jgi:X-X-X-Leu-X-X-Gly heptad repeat protein
VLGLQRIVEGLYSTRACGETAVERLQQTVKGLQQLVKGLQQLVEGLLELVERLQ